MSNPWVVEPEESKIELEWVVGDETHKFWIKVKKNLSVGEQRRMMKNVSVVSAPVQRKGAEPEPAQAKLEWTEYSFARCSAYLLDWSLADENDKKLPVTRSTMESLHTELFEIIDDAVDTHESSTAEEKKVKSGGTKPKTTSS